MIIVTAESIAGHRIVRTLGLVRGNTIRARHVGKDILAAFRNIVGGEISEYTKMLELEEVGLTFEPSAIEAIAFKTLNRGTGARGLRAVIEELMRDLLFEIPSRGDVREVVITKESVEEKIAPLLVLHPEMEKKEA